MSSGAVALAATYVLMVGIAAYLVGAMLRSIRREVRGTERVWKDFSLSLVICVLFLLSWAGQAVAQWQEFTDEQKEHEQPVTAGDFMASFAQSTFENWQSEFLQLFSFVVMSALLNHHGSAESKDSDDRMEAALKRIEQKLGTRS